MVNYEDPNYNVGLPVFMIHGASPPPSSPGTRLSRGCQRVEKILTLSPFFPSLAGNHDDPAGGENLSAVDLLSTCNLVNYFGKHTLSGSGTGKIKIKPVLMQKGNTRVALYGLGYIRDARLHQMFSVKGNVEWARPEDKPGMRTTSWFNTMLIHQNRVHHTPKNAISERYLPSWLDLVVWGHEHECLVEPTDYGDFSVSQPGSSVVTSLVEGEAKKKQVLLLEVQADPENPDGAPYWRGTPIPLETVRPFKYTQISLVDEARRPVEQGGLGPDWTGPEANAAVPDRARGRRPAAAQHEAWVHALLERNVEEMIEEVLRPHVARAAAGGPEVPLPLIRLRVDYSGGFSTINAQRFGQRFVGKVANPNDLLQFHKSATRRAKGEDPATAAAAAAAAAAEDEEVIGNPAMQDQKRIETLVSHNLTGGLQLLSETDMSNALDDFVNRDAGAISRLIEQRVKETRALVEERGEALEEDDVEKAVGEAVEQRLARANPTARAQAAAAAAEGDAANAEAPTAAETAAEERERTRRMMDAATRAGDENALDAATPTPRNAFEALTGRGSRAPSAVTPPRGSRRSAAAPVAAAPAAAAAATGGLDGFLAPSQASKPASRGGGGRSAASGRGGGRGRGGRGARRGAAESDSGDEVSSAADDDSGDDDDVVPMSEPAGRGRPGARPTRAVAAAKAAASTRTRGGRARPARVEEDPERDDFDFVASEDEDEDDDVVEDSGDDAEEIRPTGRGAKRKPSVAGKAHAKKAKMSPAKRAPPGRTRATRVVEIDDSGDEEDMIPASIPRSTRRSTRAR